MAEKAPDLAHAAPPRQEEPAKVDVSIRSCGPGDAEALSLVGAATFLEAYAGQLPGRDILAHCRGEHSVQVYDGWLADSACRAWLVEAVDGAPVGYAVVAPAHLPVEARDGDLELKRIYMLHRFQGGGSGTRLLSAAAGHAKTAGAERLLLGVWSRNHSAQAFYERQGFTVIGRRRFQVGANVHDDLLLALDLGAAAA